MGEKNSGRANLIKQRRYDLVPVYAKGVQKKYVHLLHSPKLYLLFCESNPNLQL
jgi:hypothetical protein